MFISIAIKNALLVVVIVLIAHVLIKRHMLETFVDTQTPISDSQRLCVEPTIMAPSVSPSVEPSNTVPFSTGPFPPASSCTKQPTKGDSESALYDFVFNDGACNMSSTEIEKATLKEAKEPGKQSVNMDQVVVNMYDNELGINGGTLYGNLKGYDETEADFMAYQPSMSTTC